MAKAKKPARKAAPKAPQSIKSVLTKSALVAHLAEATKGARVFVLPGLLKITVTSVAAKPARKGTNPFTGEPTTFKAKPATVKVKVRPMKKLKDAAKA